MNRTILLLTLLSMPCWHLGGMDKDKQDADKKTSSPPQKKTTYNLKGSVPPISIPSINVLPPSQPPSTLTSPRLLKTPKKQSSPDLGAAYPISPRVQPKTSQDSAVFAQGDMQLYKALTGTDLRVLTTFLHNAEADTALKIWWMDFILNRDLGSILLTADNTGRTYTLIETLIYEDTKHPIDGSQKARIAEIFPCLHASVQRDILWIDTAQKYKNEEARLFISEQTMKRDNSSFISGESDDSATPRHPGDDGDSSHTLDDEGSSDAITPRIESEEEEEESPNRRPSFEVEDANSDSSNEENLPPMNARQQLRATRLFNQRIMGIFIGITACVIVCALLRAWYADEESSDEQENDQIIPDTDLIL